MCKRNCSTCAGHICEEDNRRCMKNLDLNSVSDKCTEWFPHECPVTGMPFKRLEYGLNGKDVALYSLGHYTSYTIAEYNEQDQTFRNRAYDEDEGIWEDEYKMLCSLDEIKEEVTDDKFEEIKQFYNIK